MGICLSCCTSSEIEREALHARFRDAITALTKAANVVGGVARASPATLLARLWSGDTERDTIAALYTSVQHKPEPFAFFAPQLMAVLMARTGGISSRRTMSLDHTIQALEMFLLARAERDMVWAHRLRWTVLAFGGDQPYTSALVGAISGSGIMGEEAEQMTQASILGAIDTQGGHAVDAFVATNPKLPFSAARGSLSRNAGIDKATRGAASPGSTAAVANTTASNVSAYRAAIDFWQAMLHLSTTVSSLAPDDRTDRLRVGLQSIAMQSLTGTSVAARSVYCPVGLPGNRVVGVRHEQCFAFRTATRAPFFLVLEVVDHAVPTPERAHVPGLHWPHPTKKSAAAAAAAAGSAPSSPRYAPLEDSDGPSPASAAAALPPPQHAAAANNYAQVQRAKRHRPHTWDLYSLSDEESSSSSGEDELNQYRPPGAQARRAIKAGVAKFVRRTHKAAASAQRALAPPVARPSPGAAVRDGSSHTGARSAEAYAAPASSAPCAGAASAAPAAAAREPKPAGLGRNKGSVNRRLLSDMSDMASPVLPPSPSGNTSPDAIELTTNLLSAPPATGDQAEPQHSTGRARGVSTASQHSLGMWELPDTTASAGGPSLRSAMTAEATPGPRAAASPPRTPLYAEVSSDAEAAANAAAGLTDIEHEAMELHSRVLLSPPAAAAVRAAEAEGEDTSQNTVVFTQLWADKERSAAPTTPWSQAPGWRLLPVIVKTDDDLRQEQFASQALTLMAAAWKKGSVSAWVRPYDILALEARGGIIEAVPDTISLDALIRSATSAGGFAAWFKRFFGRGVDGSRRLRAAQLAFAKSLAGYSIATYVLQIKDRHNGNILMDAHGHLIHIDFGFLLMSSPGGNVGFESAPFKLPIEWVKVLGGSKSRLFQYYTSLCVRAYLELRRKRYELMLLVHMTLAANPDLPCFCGRGAEVLNQLEQRLRPGLSAADAVAHVHTLIAQSLGSMKTTLYDRYQNMTQGIAY